MVQASLDFLFYARRTSNSHHERYSYSLLGPGTLTAHRRFHLVLLHSCPDTVQRFPLRKTKTSTPLTRGSFTVKHPGQNITPALAACRYRAPLTPRLCGLVKYTWKPWFCQVFPPFSPPSGAVPVTVRSSLRHLLSEAQEHDPGGRGSQKHSLGKGDLLPIDEQALYAAVILQGISVPDHQVCVLSRLQSAHSGGNSHILCRISRHTPDRFLPA